MHFLFLITPSFFLFLCETDFVLYTWWVFYDKNFNSSICITCGFSNIFNTLVKILYYYLLLKSKCVVVLCGQNGNEATGYLSHTKSVCILMLSMRLIQVSEIGITNNEITKRYRKWQHYESNKQWKVKS